MLVLTEELSCTDSWVGIITPPLHLLDIQHEEEFLTRSNTTLVHHTITHNHKSKRLVPSPTGWCCFLPGAQEQQELSGSTTKLFWITGMVSLSLIILSSVQGSRLMLLLLLLLDCGNTSSTTTSTGGVDGTGSWFQRYW